MNRIYAAAALLVSVGCATTALAQRPAGGGFDRGAVGLLSIAEVQKELGITDAQQEKLQALRGERGNQQNPSREERQKRYEELTKKADETIKSVLDEKQQLRLAELRIQREGAGSLARADIAAKIGLDQAQKDQITKIQADNMPRERPNFQRKASQEERQKLLAEARERREKMNAALLAVLTPAQKETFEKLQGAKFTFPQVQGRRVSR